MPDVAVGDKRMGKVMNVAAFGSFVEIAEGTRHGLLHVSRMNIGRDANAKESPYQEGVEVEVRLHRVSQNASLTYTAIYSFESQK